jgi:hypothetical protein
MTDRPIEIEITIKAPVDAVWRAITEADGLTRWFCREARVTPGEGGSVWISWGNGIEGESPITIWEPNKRLRTGSEETGIVDYYLDGGSGETRLRIVQSGFGQDWGPEYDAVKGAWPVFLWLLRRTLEDRPGHQVVESIPAPGPASDRWPEILALFGMTEGPTTTVTIDGETSAATVEKLDAPGYLAASLESGPLLAIFNEVGTEGGLITIALAGLDDGADPRPWLARTLAGIGT